MGSGFVRPFIRRGHALRRGEPRRMKGRQSLRESKSQKGSHPVAVPLMMGLQTYQQRNRSPQIPNFNPASWVESSLLQNKNASCQSARLLTRTCRCDLLVGTLANRQQLQSVQDHKAIGIGVAHGNDRVGLGRQFDCFQKAKLFSRR